MIKILDKFLPKSLQDDIESKMLDTQFGWYYFSETADKHLSHTDNNVMDSYQFTHTIYFFDTGVNSDYYMLIKKILNHVEKVEDIKVKKLFRIKANFTVPNINFKLNNYTRIHKDYGVYNDENNKNVYSFLYYVNDSDGDTRFFDDKLKLINSYKPKKGTGVLFKSSTLHSGSCPVNHDKRLVVNFIFEVDND